MDRLRYWLFRATSGLKHRLTRRFTPAGLLALSALAGTAIWGVDTTQSMAYQAFTLLLSVVLLSAASGLLFRGKFRVERRLPRFGTAGAPLAYTVAVENLGRAPQRELAFIEDLPDPRPSLAEFRAERRPEDAELFWLDRLVGFSRWRRLVERRRISAEGSAPVPDLPPLGRGEAAVRLKPARRGRLELPAACLAKPDVFGLFRGMRRQALPQSVLILPKRYAAPRLSLPGLRRYQQGGVALSSSIGDSQEFMSLRDYRPGDPLRRVHWRSFARLGKPVVKEYEDEYFVRHALALDTFVKPGDQDLFEEAVSVASSFACSALTQESLLDVLFVGDRSYCFTAGRGLGGQERLLEVLACAQACPDKGFDELAGAVARRQAVLSGALLVLVGWDQARRDLVERLSAGGLPVVALVLSRPGETLDARGLPARRLELGRIQEDLAAL